MMLLCLAAAWLFMSGLMAFFGFYPRRRTPILMRHDPAASKAWNDLQAQQRAELDAILSDPASRQKLRLSGVISMLLGAILTSALLWSESSHAPDFSGHLADLSRFEGSDQVVIAHLRLAPGGLVERLDSEGLAERWGYWRATNDSLSLSPLPSFERDMPSRGLLYPDQTRMRYWKTSSVSGSSERAPIEFGLVIKPRSAEPSRGAWGSSSS